MNNASPIAEEKESRAGNPPQDDIAADNQTGGKAKLFIKTFGCQMNVYDSQRMEDLLSRTHEVTDRPEDADLIVLNTCHIREKAAEKVYSDLGRLRGVRNRREKAGKKTRIAVTGCVAQAEGREIIARAPVVDMVVGPQSYHRIGEHLRQVEEGRKVVATEFAIEEKFAATAARPGKRQVAAFLTVQEGCDKFCSFCVVPYTRGAEVSRPAAQILEEARRLADQGVREITLLGQNVNAWTGTASGQRMRLGDLLERVSAITGIGRLRYTTSHPVDMEESLIAAHRDLPALMPYLHLPVQAGSNRILKAMNRRHDREFYLEVIEKVRSARPDIAISGDFITGFPGEEEVDFSETLDIVRRVGYASAYSFKYSKRPGTPGADLPGQVGEAEKERRLHVLQALLAEQQARFNHACLGREFDVLLEKPARREGQLAGRSPYLQTVIVDASAGEIGDIVRVRITHAGPNSLNGEKAARIG
jgi:tRNA-2-methylthio-N6-dimethylallyladenosine synthase